MRRLFVHCGLHKTGTTAIQFFANRNRDALLKKFNLSYPLYIDKSSRKHQSHLQLFSDLKHAGSQIQEGRPLTSFSHAHKYCNEIRLTAEQQTHDLLLSAECISSYNSMQLKNIARYLVTSFSGFEIQFIFSYRDQLDLAESLYRNSFRAMKKRPPSIKEFMVERSCYFDYKQRANLHQEISNLHGIRFKYIDYCATINGMVPHFLGSIGLLDIESGLDAGIALIKNPTLDTIDCMAKDIVSLVYYSREDWSASFNKFAFQNPLRTRYSFIQPWLNKCDDERLIELMRFNYKQFYNFSSAGPLLDNSFLDPVSTDAIAQAAARAGNYICYMKDRA